MKIHSGGVIVYHAGMANAVRIATRASALAVRQSERVAHALKARRPDLDFQLARRTTRGDEVTDRPLWREGGKALFVGALEEMLLDGSADVAVHSLKDMPTALTDGLTLAAVLPRADAADAFVSARSAGPDALPDGAVVGTCSLRRRSQLLHRRPDLRCENLRGNIDTRLAKLDAGELDAVVLACAGLARLDLAARITARLPAETMLPAIGQGAIGVECRADDAPTLDLLRPLDDARTRRCVDAERAFGRALGADCHSSVAAHAECENGRLELQGLAAAPDGARLLRTVEVGASDEPVAVGEAAARRLLEQGAGALLALRPE